MTKPPRIAILDTNVLLLYLVGQTDPSLLKTFKRVDSFETTDLRLLADVLRSFDELLTTPHVLSEASNFVDQCPPYRRVELTAVLRQFAETHTERYEEALRLVGRDEFRWLALTDTGLSSLSMHAVVITTDYRLANHIAYQGGHVINFNHLRGNVLLSR